MKTARKTAVSFELTCPECGAPIYAPNGSMFWTDEELSLAVGDTATCESGHALRMPKPRREGR